MVKLREKGIKIACLLGNEIDYKIANMYYFEKDMKINL
jgi:hypothetical protein